MRSDLNKGKRENLFHNLLEEFSTSFFKIFMLGGVTCYRCDF